MEKQSKQQPRRREKGSGSVIKKRGAYYLRLRHLGNERLISLKDSNKKPVTNRAKALTIAADLKNIIFSSSIEELETYVRLAKIKASPGVSINRVWEENKDAFLQNCSFRTASCYSSSIQNFLTWVCNTYPKIKNFADIDFDMVTDYVRYLQEDRKLRSSSVNQAVLNIKRFFRLVYHSESTPIQHLKTPPSMYSKRINIPDAVADLIIEEIDECIRMGNFGKNPSRMPTVGIRGYRTLFMLCRYTGMRVGDAKELRWSNIDMGKDRIWYIPRKTARFDLNKVGITVPVCSELKSELTLVRSTQPENSVFAIGDALASRSLYGVKKRLNDVIRRVTDKVETTACEPLTDESKYKFKLAKYSIHSLRHSFISTCINNGAQSEVVASMVGHRSLKTTYGYTHISDDSKVKAIRALTGNTVEGVTRDDKIQQIALKLNALPDGVVNLLLTSLK